MIEQDVVNYLEKRNLRYELIKGSHVDCFFKLELTSGIFKLLRLAMIRGVTKTKIASVVLPDIMDIVVKIEEVEPLLSRLVIVFML